MKSKIVFEVSIIYDHQELLTGRQRVNLSDLLNSAIEHSRQESQLTDDIEISADYVSVKWMEQLS